MPVGLKRAVVSIAALALALPLAAQAPARAEPLVAAAAASAPASRTFTSTIDPYAQYLGQTLCSPTSKPGLLKVADLLRATYGPHDIGITRPCSDGGVSEHKEGRALDWMVNRRVKAERQQANAFLAWLLADDEFGNPDAMARRLGVMYIGWDDRMWRSYDPNRGTNGWDDLKGCTTNDAMKATSYDTYCHRNHVHLSFSWDGADGTTSFWTGRPVSTPDCASSSPTVAARSAGTRTEGQVLLDTGTGAGTAAGTPCRLGAERWSGDDRTLKVRVPMPAPEAGVTYGLLVRVERFASNAPGALRLDTAATSPVSLAASHALPYEVVLPIAANGVLAASTNAGQAFVRVVGLGLTRMSANPVVSPPTATPPPGGAPKSSLHVPPTVVTGTSIAFTGRLTNVPTTARVQRYLKVGTGRWAARGPLVRPSGAAWSTSTAAPSPQTLRYKVAVVVSGKVVAWSRKRTVVVTAKAARPRSSLHLPTAVTRSAALVLTGRVRDAPAGSTVQRYLKVGSTFEPRGAAVIPAGAKQTWRLSTTAPSAAGPLTYRIAVRLGAKVIGWSTTKTVSVR